MQRTMMACNAYMANMKLMKLFSESSSSLYSSHPEFVMQYVTKNGVM